MSACDYFQKERIKYYEKVSDICVYVCVIRVSILFCGVGSSGNPWIIETAAQLNDVRFYLGAHFKVSRDFDLSDYLMPGEPAYDGGAGWAPIGNNGNRFTGSFDGNGKAITGLWINRGGEQNVGLFGYTEGAVIKNLGVVIGNDGVKGGVAVGGLVGWQSGGDISNCYTTGSVSGSNGVGGLAGRQNSYGVSSSSISNCYATGGVSGDSNVGGLVGYHYISSGSSSISNCYAMGGVSGTSSVGGLVGYQYGGGSSIIISNCYATGGVSGTTDVGGLVGYQYGYGIVIFISNCYATGGVSGTSDVGGLVGSQSGGGISNCYAAGSVAATDAGAGAILGISRSYGSSTLSSNYRYAGLTVT